MFEWLYQMLGMSSKGQLNGLVTDTQGNALASVMVLAKNKTAQTNSLGRYQLRSISTGPATLVFRKNGYRRLEMTVNIAAGPNTINVTMTLITGTLSGKVTASDTGAGLAGVTVTLGAAVVQTDSSGNYGISAVPPGSYPLKFEKAGYTTINM
jgi:uncharacterized membrane protein